MNALSMDRARPGLLRRLVLTAAVLLGAVLFTSCGRGNAQGAGDVSADAPGAPSARDGEHQRHAGDREPGRAHEDASAREGAAGHQHGDGEEAGAPASDLSVYQLTSSWIDQHGQPRQLQDLAGRPRAIAMVYTHCGSACPRIVGDLKRLEAEFPRLGLVLVSIDPERDTPGRLRAFAAGTGLGERWTLLNGDDGALMELAAVLGVRYRRVSETDFMHSNLITILDARGNIAYRQEGIGETARTIASLRQLPTVGAAH